jgi:hypothetical protein
MARKTATYRRIEGTWSGKSTRLCTAIAARARKQAA